MLPLYFLALLALSLKSIRSHSGYLVMALSLICIHCLIFGFSEYSQYAEAGTAINRFLLQTLPVLIVTISAGWPIYAGAQYSVKAEHGVRKWQPRLLTALVPLLGTGVSLPIALALFSQNPDHISTAVAQSYQPSELRSVLGELEPKDDGHRFKALNVPVGVAAIPLSVTDISQPRYLTIQAWMNEPETLFFYWINSKETGVHSTPISLSGHSLLDMAVYPDYWRQPIREMGLLVKPQYFHDVIIGPIAVTGSLFDALPALLHHWITPAPLSHRLINTTTGHVQTPVTLNILLVVALAIFFLIGVCVRLLIPTQDASVTRGVTIGIFILWAIGSAAHVSQTLALSKPHLSHAPNSAVAADLAGGHLLELVESISNDSVLSGAPILSLALDDASQFAAQRIPFMLLPIPATVIDTAQLNEIIEEFSGGLLMFAKDESRMRDMADALAGRANLQIRQSGRGYLLLSREAE
ncbi:MAG: hypothetical protein O2981_01960 [Proteobacteria bacterium]|nr:hypothetical protein [Pseudomonadota bacterium]